jgi:hypothetical protein
MSLSPTDVIAISAVLIGVLVTIWVVWIRKEFSEALGSFRIALRRYRKRKSKSLLANIKECAGEKDEEEALDEISKYTNNWFYLTNAVSELMQEDRRVNRWAKYVLVLFALTFLMGIHASGAPQEIFTGEYTRLDVLLGLFALEILASLYWVWKFISFNRKMMTISTGESEDIEEIVEEVVKEIQEEEEE